MKKENEIILDKVSSRLGSLKTERSSFVDHWREIDTFINPTAARFLRSERNQGHKRMQEILNETATLSLRTLESGLMAGMSSPARPWFLLAPPDPGMKEFGPVKDWIDIVTRKMRDVFIRSNIYSVLPRAYGNLGAFATAAFAVLEDEKETIRGYPFPIGSFYIDANSRMTVDTLYREYSMTVRQIVERFGEYNRKTGAAKWENISQAVRNLWDRSNYGAWIPIVHAVEPNFSARDGMLDARDKPFLSAYMEEGSRDGVALRISGFDEFPCLAPRWRVEGEDVYGTSCPGMLALGGTKALQLGERRGWQALDKLVNPAMNVDATLRNSGYDFLPGGVNFIPNMAQTANAGARPIYEINPHIQELDAKMARLEERIRRCFFEDLMLMFATSDNPEMTAREVDERHQEKLLVLGPMMEQQNDDLFDPLIDRTFNICQRRGMFPPPPKELQGQPLRVEYTSIMAQAQKLVGVAAVERFVGFVMNIATTTQRPELLDKVDFDQTIDEYADMTGVAAKTVRPDDAVAAIRDSRAQADQRAQMTQMVPAMKDGAQAVKTLSETDPSGLAALLGGLGGGA